MQSFFFSTYLFNLDIEKATIIIDQCTEFAMIQSKTLLYAVENLREKKTERFNVKNQKGEEIKKHTTILYSERNTK